jgi:hypothetical protein
MVLLRHLAPADPAILIAFTFEGMVSHRGGKIYDSMFPKSKTWKQMYRAMSSRTS